MEEENKCRICKEKIGNNPYPFCKKCDKKYSFYVKEIIIAEEVNKSIQGLSDILI